MGNALARCCKGDEKVVGYEKNLTRKGEPSRSEKYYGNVDIWTLIKFQALMRGYLARKKVREAYGWEMTPGLM